MSNLSKAFIISALSFFVLGATVGVLILLSRMRSDWGGWDYYLIPTHTHLNLLGWMSMTIYAMGYRAFPAFFGKNLYSLKLAWVHFWLANAGLLGMGLFFLLERVYGGRWIYPLVISGIFQIAGIYLFVYNMAHSILSKTPPAISPRSY